jgi:hypothetical protein
MKLSDYLEHLTDENWHTLRKLIELQLGQLDEEETRIMEETYTQAITYSQDRLWGNYIKSRKN